MENGNKIVTLSTLSYFKDKLDISITNQIQEASPRIGENGNWFINGVDSGISASGGGSEVPGNRLDWGTLGTNK